MSQKEPGRKKAQGSPEEHREIYGLQTLMQAIKTEKHTHNMKKHSKINSVSEIYT